MRPVCPVLRSLSSWLALACAYLLLFGLALHAQPTPTSPLTVSLQVQGAAAASATCLQAPGAAATNGLALTAGPCTRTAAQRFTLVPTGTGSTVSIHAPAAFSLCVDVNDTGQVVQYYCFPTPSQQWTLATNADGSYSLTNGTNGQCLTPTATGFGLAACATAAAAAGTPEWTELNPTPSILPAIPVRLTPPTIPVPNGGLGVWQAGSFQGMPYRILFPQGYDPTSHHYTLLLFLHGAGEAGTDNLSQLNDDMVYAPQSVDFGQDVPIIMVAPQCPTNDTWGDATEAVASPHEALAVQLVQMLQAALPVDPARVGVTGLSMGGIGTWDMINRFPGVFTFAAPIAGAGLPSEAANLLNIPIVAVHGSDDADIPAFFDEAMYSAIQGLGGTKMIYVELPGYGHNVWDATYTSLPFWLWVETGEVID